MKKNNIIYWVSIHTFRWAQRRWQGRDLRINTYINDSTLLVTKPNNYKRYLKICPVIAEYERAEWKRLFEMSTVLKKAMKK